MLAEVFRTFGPAYLNKYEDDMLPSHRQALKDILACQTDALGGSLHTCEGCGEEHYSFHSCGSRFCPICILRKTDQWVDKLKREALPVSHFHVIVTLPSELREIMRNNQQVAYPILMRSAFDALQKLAKDPRHLGGRIGGLCVLHTWSRTMSYHPHVHFAIPAGAIAEDGEAWIDAKPGYLVPVNALKKVFRAIFVRRLRKAIANVQIPEAIWRKSWSIHINRFDGGIDNLINYLGRYIHRLAISKSRILKVTEESVTFKGEAGKPITLSGEEFIRRYLQHVLPKGFHKVRRYGILHSSHSETRARIRLALGSSNSEPIMNSEAEVSPTFVCRYCGCTNAKSMLIAPTRYKERGPP